MLGKSCLCIFAVVLVALLGGILLGFVTRAVTDLKTARLVLVYGDPSNMQSKSFMLNESRLLAHDPHLNHSRPHVLLIHSKLESPKTEIMVNLIQAYLQQNETNVLAVDWTELAKGNLMFDVTPNVGKIGPIIGSTLLDLYYAGFNIKNLHIVGRGHGAVIAALIGREVKRLTKDEKQITRITALDPIFIPYSLPFSFQIHQTDAFFIDVIHTDAWILGSPFSLGHTDFWPNGGDSPQPGCEPHSFDGSSTDFCSHNRAVYYYIESIQQNDTYSFSALKCPSWYSFQSNMECNTNDIESMGIKCDFGARGNYYLQTNDTAPYSRDMDGAYFDRRKIFYRPDPVETQKLMK